MNIGEIINLQAGGWPSTLCGETRAVVTAYDYNSNIVGTSNATVVSGNFETDMSSSGYTLSCSQGQSETFDLRYTIRINGGPEREIRPYSGTHVEVYNGFDALTPEPINPRDNTTIAVGEFIPLRSVISPNLANSVNLDYVWGWLNADTGTGIGYFDPIDPTRKENRFASNTPGDYDVYYQAFNNQGGGGTPVRSGSLRVSVKTKLIIDEPVLNDTFFISSEPVMPTLRCKAHLDIPTEKQNSLIFKWYVRIGYGTDSLVRINNNITGPNEWILDQSIWGNDVAGGYVLVKVKVDYLGNTYEASNLDSLNHYRCGNIILGQNIPGDKAARQAVVSAYIDSKTNYSYAARSAAKAAACYEIQEGFIQFNNKGLPYGEISGRGGWGMMQLTYKPYINMNTLWNWTANVDSGLSCCQERYIWAVNDFRRHAPNYQPNNEEKVKQILAKYNGIPSTEYYEAYRNEIDSSIAFRRPDKLCSDCGSCDIDARGNNRNGEHYKDEQHANCEDTNPCIITRQCYSDGAYSCYH